MEESMRARIITTIVLWLILVMAVACGTAESPDPTAAPGAEPTAVATTGDTSQPTAVPQETAPSGEVEVSPGELRVMVGISPVNDSTSLTHWGLRETSTMGGSFTGFSSRTTSREKWFPV